MTQFVLLLGSNRDDAIAQLEHAVESLIARWGVSQLSAAQRSAPRDGEADIASYLNQALVLDSDLSAAELKLELKVLETSLGRLRPMPASGICAIDIDIVLSRHTDSEAWQVLDPKTLSFEYARVALAPWLELAPLRWQCR